MQDVQNLIDAHKAAADAHERAQKNLDLAGEAYDATAKATTLTTEAMKDVPMEALEKTEIAFSRCWEAVEGEDDVIEDDRESLHGQAAHAHDEVVGILEGK